MEFSCFQDNDFATIEFGIFFCSLIFCCMMFFQNLQLLFSVRLLQNLLLFQMGNQNSAFQNEQFKQDDWVRKQELPDFKVWESKREPFQRIEQYQIFTHNGDEVKREIKILQLRRRNPLLVAAYYLQSRPNNQFCSFYSQHTLYLERIPLRLCDIEHVPYPDYLHLYDACLKGFAQLTRYVGYFPVNEAMIGINERGIAKAWLNQNLAVSYPINLKINQENMVRSLIDSIDRSIDSQLLPPSVPSVRNFLYKNSDSINFDNAIWSLGQFIRNFNGGQIPIKLDCIDRVGGIYAIANRQNSAKLGRSSVSNRQLNKSNISNHQFEKGNTKVSTNLQQPFTHSQANLTFAQSANLKLVRSQSNLLNQKPIQLSQRVTFVKAQIKKAQISNIYPPQPYILNSNPSNNVGIYNQHHYRPIEPQKIIFSNKIINNPITGNPNIEQKIIGPPSGRSSHQIIQQMPFTTPQRNAPQPKFTPRVMNAPKFTVQVIPGKVIPQKSSTIFIQSSSKVIPAQNSQKKISLLEQNNPVLTSSKKQVQSSQHILKQQQTYELKNAKVAQNISQQIQQLKDNIIEHDQAEHIEQIQDLKQNSPFVHNEQVVQIANVQIESNNHDNYQIAQNTQPYYYQLPIQSTKDVENQLIVSFNPSNMAFSQEKDTHNYIGTSYQAQPQHIQDHDAGQLEDNNYQYQTNYYQHNNNKVGDYTDYGIYQPENNNFNYNYSYSNNYNSNLQSETVEPHIYLQTDYNTQDKFQMQYPIQQNSNYYDSFNSKIRNAFQPTAEFDDKKYSQFYQNPTNSVGTRDYSSILESEGKNSYKFISQLSEFEDANAKRSFKSIEPIQTESMKPSNYSDYLNSLVSQSNEIYNDNYEGSKKTIIDSLEGNKYEFSSYGFKPSSTIEYDI